MKEGEGGCGIRNRWCQGKGANNKAHLKLNCFREGSCVRAHLNKAYLEQEFPATPHFSLKCFGHKYP